MQDMIKWEDVASGICLSLCTIYTNYNANGSIICSRVVEDANKNNA